MAPSLPPAGARPDHPARVIPPRPARGHSAAMASNPNRGYVQPSGAWAGWVAFAGIMLALIGFFDILQGITALTDDGYFVVKGEDLLVFDFTTFGWFLLLWGILLILVGIGLFMGKGAARWIGVILAFVNAIAQIAFLSAYPIWSTIVIALDVFVIFALTARWHEAQAAMRED
jgi:hypothetical protein